ncbi:MAG: HAD family hydrolase [Desulfuromonadales bacterium]|nr:HAD family hydrolase [Desulfuromonadales bacterium]
MPKTRGVILDLDGTLIDSNDAHARAWLEAMSEAQFDPPFAKVRRLIGMGGEFLLPAALGIAADSDIGRRISGRRQEIFRQDYLPQLKPFPKVRELLEKMQQVGQLVVASASQREELEQMLELAGIADLLQETTSASEVDDPKPEPDVVLAALDKMALGPEQVLLLGDTPYDIEAAGKVGVKVVAMECGGWSAAELAGAMAVYRDPADLLARFELSPFAMYG